MDFNSASPSIGVNDELSPGLLTAPSFELPRNDKEGKENPVYANGTTVGFIYKGGVIVAADSRLSHKDGYIVSESAQKISEITPYLLATAAGSAADCQYWHRYLKKQCQSYESVVQQRVSVAEVSWCLASTFRRLPDFGLDVETLIAGWGVDGAALYYVNARGVIEGGGVVDNGNLVKRVFCAGSGATHASKVLDRRFSYVMSYQEAVMLARRAIYEASIQDGPSGGVVSVYTIGPNGSAKILANEIRRLTRDSELSVEDLHRIEAAIASGKMT